MKTISQQQLRNHTAEVLRGVEAGETYTVTRRGAPVAVVAPVRAATELRCDRPPRKHPLYARQRRVQASTPPAALLEELRADR